MIGELRTTAAVAAAPGTIAKARAVGVRFGPIAGKVRVEVSAALAGLRGNDNAGSPCITMPMLGSDQLLFLMTGSGVMSLTANSRCVTLSITAQLAAVPVT